jgi:hypothetical protein
VARAATVRAMPPIARKLRSTVAVAGVLAGGLAATASALAQSGGAPTQITVGAASVLAAPARSPIDFPGARDARQGAPLPTGEVVVARQVAITRGDDPAQATVTLTCPPRMRVRSAGASEIPRGVAAQLPRTRAGYRGRRSVRVVTDFDARAVAKGQTASGTLYALCS